MGGSGSSGDKAAVLAAFGKQIGWCNSLGAPFTAQLLTLLAEDIARGGAAAGIVTDRAADPGAGDPEADALALRLAGALHALVLTGVEPALAACYPPGGDGNPERLGSAVSTALDRHGGFIRGFLASPPQTNEVGRSAVLLGGFLQVAGSTRLPLRLLEIGSSAGLNLIWDSYQYRLGGGSWGDPASPVRLEPEWHGPPPPLATALEVSQRAGCDVMPIDLGQQDQRLRLRSYVWADQPDRLARLDAAITVARRVGISVEQADAGAWVRDRLAEPVPGQATVLYHSIMWQYMPAATQAAVRAAIDQAGGRATDAAPLAWLRFEPPRPDAKSELLLTSWPGERRYHLATAHPHGRVVTWLGTGPEAG